MMHRVQLSGNGRRGQRSPSPETFQLASSSEPAADGRGAALLTAAVLGLKPLQGPMCHGTVGSYFLIHKSRRSGTRRGGALFLDRADVSVGPGSRGEHWKHPNETCALDLTECCLYVHLLAGPTPLDRDRVPISPRSDRGCRLRRRIALLLPGLGRGFPSGAARAKSPGSESRRFPLRALLRNKTKLAELKGALKSQPGRSFKKDTVLYRGRTWHLLINKHINDPLEVQGFAARRQVSLLAMQHRDPLRVYHPCQPSSKKAAKNEGWGRDKGGGRTRQLLGPWLCD